jgi:hypothetical protein
VHLPFAELERAFDNELATLEAALHMPPPTMRTFSINAFLL